jgi:hypothetical protein
MQNKQTRLLEENVFIGPRKSHCHWRHACASKRNTLSLSIAREEDVPEAMKGAPRREEH